MGDVIAMRHAILRLDEDHASGPQRTIHLIRDRDTLLPQHLHQFLVVPLGVTRIGADEKARPVVRNPGCELVQLAIDGIEQEHAADAIAEPAHFEAPGGRHEATAVADQDDRQVRKLPGRSRVAIEAGEMTGRFIDEALQPAGLPELAGAGIGGIDRELRREALEANFDTRMTFGVMPTAEAIAFALGDEPFTMDLKGEDELSFEYAMAAAGASGEVDTPESFTQTVHALAEAPLPSEVDGGDRQMARVLARWEERIGDPSDEDSGIVNAAQSLASAMLDTLGFEWV